VNTVLNKPSVKIYDENENEVDIEKINDKTNIVTIVEIQGIKCSARSFQIEIDLKQMMVLEQNDLFEKCIIKTTSKNSTEDDTSKEEEMINQTETSDVFKLKHEDSTPSVITYNDNETIETYKDEPVNDNNIELTNNIVINTLYPGIEEIDFHLEDLNDESFLIKKRDDVYYEMYREARKKAKIARDLALSSYLEAKRIKNLYMLDDIDDSDDSDLELEEVEEVQEVDEENNTI
jgi:hypothetical protein